MLRDELCFEEFKEKTLPNGEKQQYSYRVYVPAGSPAGEVVDFMSNARGYFLDYLNQAIKKQSEEKPVEV